MVLATFDPFARFERQFSRLAQRGAGSAAGMPMDGVRRDGEIALRFDLPGVDPASIDVTVDRGVLTISATRDEPGALFARVGPLAAGQDPVALGGDIHTFESKGTDLPQYLREATAWLQLATAALIQLRVPVVTAVQGFAAGGGGLGLVCASDIVVAAESARFFSGARRPTQVTTRSSGATPHCARSGSLRCAASKRRTSTPRATVSRSRKPSFLRSSCSACVGTIVHCVALWKRRR